MTNHILNQLATESKHGYRTITLADRLISAHLIGGEKSRREESEAAALAEALTFTTRDDYLAWVADWKAAYAETADRIRALKRQRSPKNRPESTTPMQVLTDLYRTRVTAKALLALRKASKVRAGEQWAARRAERRGQAA
jgi:hypothetical protein